MSAHDTFRQLEFYKHWDDETWRALIQAGTPEDRFPGSRILTARRVDRFGLLLSGKVRETLSTAYGPLSLGEVKTGDFIGLEAYLDSEARQTDLEVSEDAALLVYSRSAIESLCAKREFRAAWLWTCWKILSASLRRRNRMLPRFFGTQDGSKVDTAPVLAAPQPAQVPLGEKQELFEEKRLPSMVIKFLSTLSQEERYQGGESIFREGDPGGKMYVVAEGEVMISRRLPDAGQEAIEFLKRGDFFGEMALINESRRAADATVRGGDAVLLSITRDVLEGVLDIRKVSSLRLLEILCNVMASRLRDTEHKLMSWFVLAGGEIAPEPDDAALTQARAE